MPDGRLVVHELSPIARRGEDGLPIYPAAADQERLWAQSSSPDAARR